jgi:hypothetical protein
MNSDLPPEWANFGEAGKSRSLAVITVMPFRAALIANKASFAKRARSILS